MRILIDECINPRLAPRLRTALPGHEVVTVRELGWAGRKDPLLVQEVQGVFDVFVTTDKGFAFEHNLRKISFGIVIIETENNQMPSYERVLPDIVATLRTVRPGNVRYVPSRTQRHK